MARSYRRSIARLSLFSAGKRLGRQATAIISTFAPVRIQDRVHSRGTDAGATKNAVRNAGMRSILILACVWAGRSENFNDVLRVCLVVVRWRLYYARTRGIISANLALTIHSTCAMSWPARCPDQASTRNAAPSVRVHARLRIHPSIGRSIAALSFFSLSFLQIFVYPSSRNNN